MDIDLTLVSNEQLFNELRSRHDAVVLILHRIKSANDDETEYFWSGGRVTSIGLLEFCKQELMRKQEEEDE